MSHYHETLINLHVSTPLFPLSALVYFPPCFHSPQPCWLLSPFSLGPLALILGSGSWQPHPLSYRLAGTQCPRSSFTNTMHSPAIHLPLPFNSLTTSLLSIPSFSFPLIHSLRSLNFLKLSPSLYLASLTLFFWQLGGDWWADNRNHLPPYSGAGQHERDEPELTKPLPSETKVVCSIIQTGATPTAASATLTLTNGQKNRWFVHSWPV